MMDRAAERATAPTAVKAEETTGFRNSAMEAAYGTEDAAGGKRRRIG